MTTGHQPLSEWAFQVAADLLREESPRRWEHALATRAIAEAVLPVVPGDEELLLAAAVGHDIGYADRLKHVGYSSLDAARHWRSIGAPERLADLAAHSINARLNGTLRGFGAEYADIPDEQTPVRDALWFCCLTAGPSGGRVRFEDRMDEIRARYAEVPHVLRWCLEGHDSLVAAVTRTRERLRVAGLPTDQDQTVPGEMGPANV
jgi:hypothetical protein